MNKISYTFVIIMIFGYLGCSKQSSSYQPTIANPNATTETKNLHERMVQLMKRGIMYGHQDDLVYGHTWKTEGVSDVKQVTGDFPAVFGWEIGDLELGKSYSLDSVSFDEIRKGIQWVDAAGGFNTISWHCNNPLTGGNAWDVSSNQVVKSILPNGNKHEAYLKMLEQTADFLLSLKDKNGALIPVIFRPFHENTGSWFWWGKDLCSAEDYIALWHFTIKFFNQKGLNNILYAYSSASGFTTSDEYLERYPGDDIIDIIGFDEYQGNVDDKENYMQSISTGLDIVTTLAKQNNKIPILAETGFESIPDSSWWTATLWPAIKDYQISYVLTWRNAHDRATHFYAPFPGQGSASDFVTFKNEKRTLFMKDVQPE